jgi:uracil-DNA glycosylase family 4
MQKPETYHWESAACKRCPQFSGSNVVRATPCREGGILVVGEAPGTDENRERKGFIGEAGTRLRTLLHDAGLSDDDFGVANICRCQPPKNRKPTRQEIETCLPFLVSLIQETRPKVLLAVGGRTAAHVLCGPGTLTKLIADRASAQDWSGRNTRSTFELIKPVVANVPYLVPMPHTSPRVMNNKEWRDHAIKQVGLVAELWRR